MTERSIHITVAEAESFDQLPEYLKPLMLKAQEAAKTAYAPYSQYKVGAALLLADGTIIIGNNQENIAYPSGVCAERVAFLPHRPTTPVWR
ncbi:MAG: hypothetical protein M0D57_10905 [Sphingobacteriales bacterium JAD_PAG50586_3]|nr:MAG: hypothetical protein M0D57_10905 [Sphingobacteriales bacterium JAD_PAG50586_3]